MDLKSSALKKLYKKKKKKKKSKWSKQTTQVILLVCLSFYVIINSPKYICQLEAIINT